MRRISALLTSSIVLTCSTLAMGAQPTDPTAAAIFAGRNLTFNGFTTVLGGPVIANGNVLHNGGSLNVPSMYAGGTFTDTPASFQNSTGDILFGGNITGMGGPGSVIGGNLTSGGSIAFLNTSVRVAGNVTAAGGVDQPFDFASVGGNVTAGGAVNIQGTVTGGVTYGSTLTQGVFAHIGGAIVHGGAVTPPAYVPLSLPAGRGLTAGSTNITLSTFETRAVAPGVYGTLAFATGNTVTLTAGQYVFSSITSSFSLNQLSFDTSGGAINIYVAGDLDFNVVQVINGQALFAGGNPNPPDADKIFVEVANSYVGDAPLYGTVFAPNGDITLHSFADVTGRLLAGHDVILNASNVTAVPEPSTLAVLGVMGSLLLRRRRGSGESARGLRCGGSAGRGGSNGMVLES